MFGRSVSTARALPSRPPAGFRRRLRTLLALALVCSVAVLGTGQGPAAAASGEWDRVDATVEFQMTMDFDCAQYLRLTKNNLGIVGLEAGDGGRCIGGADITPGACGPGEVTCTLFAWELRGPGCTGHSLSVPVGSHPYDSTAHVTFSLGHALGTVVSSCVPDEVCAKITLTGVWDGGQTVGISCSEVGAGSLNPYLVVPEEDLGATCSYGSASGAYSWLIDRTLFHHNPSGGIWHRYDNVKHVRVKKTALTSGEWVTYAIYDNANTAWTNLEGPGWGFSWNGTAQVDEGVVGSQQTSGTTGPGDPSWNATAANIAKSLIQGGSIQQATGVTSLAPVDARVSGMLGEGRLNNGTLRYPETANANSTVSSAPQTNAMDGSTHRVLVGVGVFRMESWGSVAVNNTSGAGGWWRLPSGGGPTDTGVVGLHNPERCAYYYGTKIWNSTSTTTDEPGGTIGTTEPPDPPVEEPPTLGDPDDDPDSDLGWLSLIWGLLKGILSALWDVVSAIGDLAGSIASAIADALTGLVDLILDGLEALFVPEDPDFFEDMFIDVKQEWRDSGPGSFVTGFSDMGVTMPGGGCGGIPVEFATQGVAVDFNIGAACSGAAATAAGIVKTVVSASLVLFGGLAAVRAIGSGFGWSPGVGKGGES